MKLRYLLTVPALFFCALWCPAEEEEVSPWDLWRQGYTAFEKGESARNRGDYVQALEHFRIAVKSYRDVQQMRPSWNQNVINSRILRCEQEMAEAKKLMERPQSLGRTAGTSSSHISGTGQPAGTDPDTLASEFVKMQTEVSQYKQRLYATIVELEELRKQAAQGKSAAAEMENMLRERRVAEEKYRLLEARCKMLEAKVALPAADMQEANRKLVEMRINLETVERKLELARSSEQRQAGENAEMIRERNALREQLNQLERRRQAAGQEAEFLKNIRSQAAQEKNQMMLKIEELEKRLAELTERLKARDTEVSTLNRRLQDAIHSRGLSTDLSTEITTENGKLRKLAAEATKQAETASDAARASQAELREQRLVITDLRKTIQSLEDRRAQTESDLKVMQQQVEKTAAAQKFAEAENANLTKRNRKLEDEVRVLSEDVERNRKRLASRDSADRAAVDALSGERANLAAQLAAQKLRAAEAKAEAENFRKRLDLISKAAAELRTEYLKTKARLLSSDQEIKNVEQITAEREKLRKELAAMQRNFSALQIEKRDLLQNRDELEKLKPELERLRKLAAQVDEVERQNQTFSDANARLTRKVEAAEAAVAQLRRQRDDALAGNARVQQERNAAESTVLVLRRQKTATDELDKTWQKKRAELEARVVAANRRRVELEKTAAAAETRAAELQKIVDRLRAGRPDTGAGSKTAGGAPGGDLKKLQSDAESAKAEKLRLAGLRERAEAEAERVRLAQIKAETEAEKVRLKRIQAETEAEQVRLKRQQEAIAAANLELKKQMDAAVSAAQSAARTVAALPGNAAAENVRTAVPAAEKLTAKQVASMLAKAAQAEKEEAWQVARWNYRKVIESDPVNFAANFGMGRIELAEEKSKTAAAYLQQAHIADETRTDVRIVYAQALIGDGKFGNALALLEGCAAADKKRFDWLYACGLAQAGAGRTEPAGKALQEALRLAPKHSGVLLALAKLPFPQRDQEARLRAARWYADAKKYGATPDPVLEKSLGKLLKERVELVEFMSGAAQEAEKHRDWNSAVWYYGQLRNLAPESGFYAERAARYCFLQKKFAEVLQMLENRPETPAGQWLRSAALCGTGKDAEAHRTAQDVRKSGKFTPDEDLLKVLSGIGGTEKNKSTMQLLSGK